MFTNLLNETEREIFMELISKMALCDGENAEEEQALIQNYQIELNVTQIRDTDSIEGLIDYFSEKNESIKRIVLFEIWGMVQADGNVGVQEEKAFAYLKEKFCLGDAKTEQIITAAKDLQVVYDRIYDAIFD